MQVSSMDLLVETSEIVSLIITLTFSAVIVKLSNFGNGVFLYDTQSTETQVEEACSLHEKDGIYVDVNADNMTAFITCHYCPRLKMHLRGFRNNVEYNVKQHIDSIDHHKWTQSTLFQQLSCDKKVGTSACPRTILLQLLLT